MDWMDSCRSLWDGFSPACNLPRHVLRHALAESGGVGNRILDVSDSASDLAPLLNYLGFVAEHVDCSGAMPIAAPYMSQDGGADLVLAHDLDVYQKDLCHVRAFNLTADLLSCLRPGGRLVLVTRRDPQLDEPPGGHLSSCFQRHLTAFPGETRQHVLPDGFLRLGTWRWVAGIQQRSGYVFSVHQIPESPRNRMAWRNIAAVQCAFPQEACCMWIRRKASRMPETRVRKVA